MLLLSLQLCLSSCVRDAYPDSAAVTLIPAASTFAASGDYRLGAGDLLSLSLVEKPELGGDFRISPQGELQLPFFSLAAQGKTLDELHDALEGRLKQYLRTPAFTLAIKEYSSFKIYLSGEINKPGEYLCERRVWLGDTLALSGGYAKFAKKRLLLIRSIDGAPQRFLIRHEDLVSGRDGLDKVYLERGDHIHFL